MGYSRVHHRADDAARAMEIYGSNISFFYIHAQHNNEEFSNIALKLNRHHGQLHHREVAAHLLSRYSCLSLGGFALFGQISNSKDSHC
jgi:hypothetical protein